jgi:hypothetical protein
MTDVAGFPLAFERQGGSAREVVLLGVVPIGAIEKLPTGRYCWSIDLPMLRQMHGAPSLDGARERVCEVLAQWLEAAASPHRRRAPVAAQGARIRA